MHPFSLISVILLASRVFSYSSTSYNFDPLKHLAGVTPPFDPLDPPLDPSPPQGCNVTRAACLIRHAAIYANDFDYETYIEPFVQKLSNTTVNWSTIPVLSFPSTWTNPLTDAEQEMQTRAGKLEATKLGVEIAQRYQALRTLEKIWTSTAERTVKSAKSLAAGLADDASDIEVVQISDGEEEVADSLTPYESCPAYSSSAGSDQSDAAVPSAPFSLLTPNEWLGFEYTNDIKYHYNTGYGSPVSGVIGFPWLNATLSTLSTLSTTKSNTSNATTDQDLYISFTHRELPPTVLMSCSSFGYESGEYWRVLVNNSPQSLDGCNAGPGEGCSDTEIVGRHGEVCRVDYGNSMDVLSIYSS
ncbi:phosphoglycerate mutase-like protein [Hyaloscypha variabilis]